MWVIKLFWLERILVASIEGFGHAVFCVGKEQFGSLHLAMNTGSTMGALWWNFGGIFG